MEGALPPAPDDAARNRREHLRRWERPLGAQVLQHLQTPSLHEKPGHTQGPVLRWDVIGQHERFDECARTVALEVLWQQLPEARTDIRKEASVGVAVMHDAYQLNSAALNDLIQHQLLIEDDGLLLCIRLEAPNVVKVRSAQRLQQRTEVLLVFLADRSEEHLLAEILLAERLHEGIAGITNEFLALRQKTVVVFVQPARGVVLHDPSVVPDGEARVKSRSGTATAPASRHLKPLLHVTTPSVLRGLVKHLQAKLLVGRLLRIDALRELTAKVIQHAERPSDSAHNGLGIGHLQVRPGQSLPTVKPLLSAEHVLHKVLLKPLVGEIDAELLKGVPLKPLEAVNVKDADMLASTFLQGLSLQPKRSKFTEGIVDPLDREFKDSLVQRFDESLEGLAELSRGSWHLVEGRPARDFDLLALQCSSELIGIHSQQPCGSRDALLVDLHRASTSAVLLSSRLLLRRLQGISLLSWGIAEVHQTSEHLQDIFHLTVVESHRLE
mmetsp:Transcript_52480/g.113638  ORF Transcript_52480/g.113638 Transcript_52480/m.113638 type:complete len:497 (-) Transcript_52480:1022-2512(-)